MLACDGPAIAHRRRHRETGRTSPIDAPYFQWLRSRCCRNACPSAMTVPVNVSRPFAPRCNGKGIWRGRGVASTSKSANIYLISTICTTQRSISSINNCSVRFGVRSDAFECPRRKQNFSAVLCVVCATGRDKNCRKRPACTSPHLTLGKPADELRYRYSTDPMGDLK